MTIPFPSCLEPTPENMKKHGDFMREMNKNETTQFKDELCTIHDITFKTVCPECEKTYFKKPDKSKLVDYPMNNNETNKLAEWLHNRYEKHAHHEGWDTNAQCKVKFKDLPEANRKTMLLVAKDLKNLLKEQEAPMGVSQWRELGKKYGYDKYFEEKN